MVKNLTMKKWLFKFVLSIVAYTLVSMTQPVCAEAPSGDATIRGKVGDSEIVIKTTSRLAGAVDSLKWKGKEFINSFDHGRQLQSAANFDLGTRFTGETFNPTEAGSRNDGRGNKSTSRLLHLVASKNRLQTTTQMAFWLLPGQDSSGNPAKNKQALSNHLLTKRITIGYRDMPHVIQHQVTFSMPIGEHHKYAQFEAVTGYMPPEFSEFWRFNPSTSMLEPLNDGPGEQAWPVVLSTKDRQYAMGVYSPQQPSKGYESAGYGRFRFPAAKVVKWNSVFRIRNLDGVPAGDYQFNNFVIVGTLETVRTTIKRLRSLNQSEGR